MRGITMSEQIKDPPSPQGEFLLGHARAFMRNPPEFLLKGVQNFGRFFILKVAHIKLYIVAEPEAVEQVLSSRNAEFIRAQASIDLGKNLAGPKSIIATAPGKEHIKIRRLMAPSFQTKRMARYAEAVGDEVDQLLASWQAGQTRMIHKDMVNLAMYIAVRIFFGSKLKEDATRVGAAFDFMQIKLAGKHKRGFGLPRWLPTPGNLKFKKEYTYVRTLVSKMLSEKEASPSLEENEDLLSSLLMARDEDGTPMDRDEIIDNAMILFFAGHETSANMLTWFFDQIADYPEIEEKIYKEIKSVIKGKEPSYDDLMKLTYTRQALKETLRKRPPAWILNRVAGEELELEGYRFKPGIRIMMPVYAIHHMPEFHKDPERFDPDRFSPENAKKIVPGSYIPFGLGPRTCIGEHFAMLEGLMALAKIIPKYRLVRPEGKGPAPLNTKLTLAVDDGLPMILEKR